MSAVWRVGEPPVPVSDDDLARGGRLLASLVPDLDQIPKPYQHVDNPWRRFAVTWLTKGLHPQTRLISEDPVSAEAAFRHLKAVGLNADLEHEHRRSAVAFLASRWFIAIRYAGPDGSDWQVVGDLIRAENALRNKRNKA